jgi:UPF0755 protein
MRKLMLFVLVLALAAAGTAALAYKRAQAPYRGFTGTEQFIDIPSGASTKAIGERLISAGVVRDALTYRIALWVSGKARTLKAGEYRFDAPMSAVDVIEKLARGEVHIIQVTFPEGLTIAEMAAIFESHGLGAAAAFVKAAQDVSLVAAFDPSARNLEGYLFPETYALTRRADASQLVRLMVARFGQLFTPDLRDAAAAQGLSVRAAVTLASIVEKETAEPAERPLVAAVYRNRLQIGMALQCDPTVIYALRRHGKYTGNLRREDLSFDSPYNTYRYAGLPPGPIAAPGQAALEAAVRPAAVEYLYFVSRNDGSHAFARTLEEHNRNVQKYQVQYFRSSRTRGGEKAPAAKSALRGGS